MKLADVTPDEASLANGILRIGVLITDVAPGRESAQAGFLAGDRIVRVANQPIISTLHFFALLSQQPRDRTLEVDVVRDGILYRARLGNAGTTPPPLGGLAPDGAH